MEFSRSPQLSNKELNLLIQATEDRIFGLPKSFGVPDDGMLPQSARCSYGGAVGQSSMPGFQALLIRAIKKSVARVENRVKLSLTPRRKTNLAKTPKEVYEDRVKYGSGGLDSFRTPTAREYPSWNDLNSEQQKFYNDDSNLYKVGTLPWDLLTFEQQETFSRQVLFVPNKIEDEERIDGKGRSYIKLYERYVSRIHKIALEIQDPQGLGIPYLNRTYAPNEYFLYKKEGGVILFPAQAKISATGASNMVASSGYGLVVPNMPQIIAVDYTFGLEEIPEDLQDAIAMFAAVKTFEAVNIAYTKGMTSYNVQGFSASFGKGLYADVMDRYKQEAEDLLSPYYMFTMTGY
jgi:hypothetical protein